LKIPDGLSEAFNWRKSDNIMAKKKNKQSSTKIKHRKFEEKTIIGFQDCIHHSQSQNEPCKIPEVNSGAPDR
jgi:hypothetical protein